MQFYLFASKRYSTRDRAFRMWHIKGRDDFKRLASRYGHKLIPATRWLSGSKVLKAKRSQSLPEVRRSYNFLERKDVCSL